MSEAARFLRDVLLDPRLRRLAETDLDAALDGYRIDGPTRDLIASQDPALLDILGEAVRGVQAPERPAAVERLSTPDAPQGLPTAALWMRLQPYAGPQVLYSVGLAPGSSTQPPHCPVLQGQPLPPIDLDIRVQPTRVGDRVSLAGSLLPRGATAPPPERAQRHAPPDHPAVRAAARAALEAPSYEAVLAVIDALLDPGEAEPGALPAPPPCEGPHIEVVGLGMVSPAQITREAEAALRRARHVLFADPSIALPDWLAGCAPRVTPLLGAYHEGDSRLHTYHHMVAATVHAALIEAPVVFAMSGHPLIGAYAPFLLLDTARALGLGIRVQPGISALDAICALLELDPILTGLQMVEGTDLVLQQRPLQPDMPALVWQIGTLGTQLHSDRRRTPDDLAPLRDHLLRFHPGSHRVKAVYASPHPLMRSRVLEVELTDLASLAPQLHAGFSLYVPASIDRPLADPALAAGLYRR